MYSLLRSLRWQEFVYQQIPALFVSFIIAELFFKFKSFTLECAAFLITWFVLDALLQKARELWYRMSL